jgi:hypothetical protein
LVSKLALCPVAPFLTGERLAASGEWEKAADSLEAQAAGTEDAWLAQCFAQRARDLRDGKGSSKALVLDSRFLVEIASHLAVKTARDSAASKQMGKWIDAARIFGQVLRQKIPWPATATREESTNSLGVP